MEQLIGKACGCVRLLLIYTPGLMQLLGLLNLMDCVWTPPSIETAKCDAIETVAYSGTCVGELVKWCQKHFEKHPEELTPDLDAEFGPNGRDDTEPFIKIKVKPALDALKTFQDWQNKVHRWREDTKAQKRSQPDADTQAATQRDPRGAGSGPRSVKTINDNHRCVCTDPP